MSRQSNGFSLAPHVPPYHQPPVVAKKPSARGGQHTTARGTKIYILSAWDSACRRRLQRVFENSIWVEIEYPNHWMITTQNGMTSVVSQLFHIGTAFHFSVGTELRKFGETLRLATDSR